MGRGIDHASPAAAGAKTPMFASKSHQQFVAATVALDAHKTVLKTTAFQVVVKLLRYESWWDAIALAQVVVEFWQAVFDDLIQQCQFRPVTNVRRRGNIGQGGSLGSLAVNLRLLGPEAMSAR